MQASAGALESMPCDGLLATLRDQVLAQVDERAAVARVAPESFAWARLAGSAPDGVRDTSRRRDAPARFSDFFAADLAAGRLYVLHGNILYVLSAEPHAAALLASLPIEGQPHELIARDGVALVFSTLWLPPGFDATMPENTAPAFTKVTTLSLRGETPEVLRELYFEGAPVGPVRAEGEMARLVLQQPRSFWIDSPRVSYEDIFGRPRPQAEIDLQVDEWVNLMRESIAASVLEDYLPRSFERIEGAVIERAPRCDDYWLPPTGLGNESFTSVVTLDLAAWDAEPRNLSLLDGASVHIGADAIAFDQIRPGYDAPQVEETTLHLFAERDGRWRYSASATLDGFVAGGLRFDDSHWVTTLRTAAGHRVLTLRPTPHGIERLGSTDHFAPDTYVSALHVADGRAAIAISPAHGQPGQLWVVDLADPRAPVLSAPLQTPGSLAELMPVSETRLLALGRRVHDPQTGFEEASLSLFDVDATGARLFDQYDYSAWAYTFPSSDARALEFDAERGLLWFPLFRLGDGWALEIFELSSEAGLRRLGGPVAGRSRAQIEECLVTFGYSVTPELWAELEANPDQLDNILAECEYFLVPPYVQRGALGDAVVHSINGASVSVHALDDLDGPPLSVVDLPQLPAPTD